MNDVPNPDGMKQPETPAEPVSPSSPDETRDAIKGDTSAVDREVAEAMSAMSAEDLAELTMGPDPSEGSTAEPAAGVQLGRIVGIQGDDVFIDLGGKTQGVMARSLFKQDEQLAVGEPVEVVIDRYDRSSDLLVLTRKGAARSADWDVLKPGDLLEGRVVGLNKGGLEVKFKGIKGFMPASHVDVMHVKDISIFLNEQVRCEVLEINRRGKTLTVSRRKVLEKERTANRQELLSQLEVGQVRKGVVGNIAEFGAFVDLGGADGMIHISDMSWGQIKHPSEVLKTGDVVEVKILKIQDEDGGKKRISLGMKQALPDPWEGIAEKFPANSTHKVRVVRLAKFGAFAELDQGVDGLIPVSEMSWSRVGSPNEVVKEGDVVDVAVIRVEPKRRRISLSMKQAQPDPWAGVVESYQPESTVKGKVVRLADFGVFVELAPGIEGLIHISELSDRRVRSCSEVVSAGQEVDVRVLGVDPDARRISLSMKPAEKVEATQQDIAAANDASKKRRRNKNLRGGLSSGWDWAGGGLGDLSGIVDHGD